MLKKLYQSYEVIDSSAAAVAFISCAKVEGTRGKLGINGNCFYCVW